MVAPNEPIPDVPLVLEAGDRFWKIVSGEVCVPADPPYTSVITFFCVLRMSGVYDIVCVHRIWEADGNVRRTAQTKSGIRPSRIQKELEAVKSAFGGGIEAATGLKFEWIELDLSGVDDPEEQVRLMGAWPGLSVKSRPKRN